MRVHWRIYGGVQGVGFREFVRRAAAREEVAGYVRNRGDGSVEVEAEGAPQAIARLRASVEAGPPHAAVRDVREEPPAESALPLPFTVRY
jgi:acylphosphatase